MIICYIYFLLFYPFVLNISLSKVFKYLFKIFVDHVIIACRKIMIIIIRNVLTCVFFFQELYILRRKNGSLTVWLEYIYCNNSTCIKGVCKLNVSKQLVFFQIRSYIIFILIKFTKIFYIRIIIKITIRGVLNHMNLPFGTSCLIITVDEITITSSIFKGILIYLLL